MHYLDIQNIRTIFGFSLYAMPLLVALVVYFRRDTQDIVGRLVHWKIESMLLLILEVGNSFS